MTKLEKPADLAGWRDYARRLERRATRKVGLIREGFYAPRSLKPIEHLNDGRFGVDIAGTNLDPRKGRGAVERMTLRQVEAHAHRLEEFMSPNVSYYRGDDNAIISAKAMLKHAYGVRRLNEKVQNYWESVKGTLIPWRGNAPASEVFDINTPYNGNSPQYKMNKDRLATPTEFPSDKAALIDAGDYLRKTSTAYDKERMSGIRSTIAKLIEGSGDPYLNKILDLPDEELFFLATTTPDFMQSLSDTYNSAMDFQGNPDDPMEVYEYNNLTGDNAKAREMADYAYELNITSHEETPAERRRRLRNERKLGR